MHVHSFPPLVADHSRVLILGSMPGKVSLQARQYYAHPRNLFWRFMSSLLEVDASAPYTERVAQLLHRGVALWDVLQSCTRSSSLDSDIEPGSTQPNDLAALLATHPKLRSLCFNGAKAEQCFRRQVLPTLPQAAELTLHKLPSTSPANASIPLERKLEAWRVVATAAGARPGPV